MGCGCGGKKKPAATLPKERATDGAWKLTVNGTDYFYASRIGAQAANLREFGGAGVVTRK